MRVPNTELGRAIGSSLNSIETQIAVVEKCAAEMGIGAHDLRDTNGGWTLTPLLVARAQLLHSVVLLTKGK